VNERGLDSISASNSMMSANSAAGASLGASSVGSGASSGPLSKVALSGTSFLEILFHLPTDFQYFRPDQNLDCDSYSCEEQRVYQVAYFIGWVEELLFAPFWRLIYIFSTMVREDSIRELSSGTGAGRRLRKNPEGLLTSAAYTQYCCHC